MKHLLAFIFFGLFMTSAIAENMYFTAQGSEEGKPIIYRSMHSVPTGEKESNFPNLINIYWRFDKSNNGMPDSQSNEKQIEFENTIAALDTNGVSHLMLVVTGNGRKEWIWYVKNTESWMEKFNELLSSQEMYPIEIEFQKDPEWSTYHNFLSSVKGL